MTLIHHAKVENDPMNGLRDTACHGRTDGQTDRRTNMGHSKIPLLPEARSGITSPGRAIFHFLKGFYPNKGRKVQ